MGADTSLLALNQGTLTPEDALSKAESALEQAHADPQWALVACMALWRLERYREAFAIHQNYQHHFSERAEAWVIAGMAARRLPDHQKDAEQAFLRAIELEPKRADSVYNLGNLYNDTGRYEEAAEAYRKSLLLDPFGAQVWHNYGIALRELNQLDASRSALTTSLQLDPSNADVWCNLGLVAHAFQNYDLAKKYYMHSIQLDADRSTTWVNLGMSLLDTLNPEEALPALEHGHRLNPDCPEALFNLALTLLLMGDYANGWQLYESRFRSKNFKDAFVPSKGPWITTLSELKIATSTEKPLLIWSEQGIGDCIQFIRYLPILQALCIPLIFSTRPCLVNLFRQWLPEPITIISDAELGEKHKELPHLALLSLPRLLRSDLATIPRVTPYLRPPGPPSEQLLVPEPPGGLAIGLTWASNPENKAMYKNKSMPLALLMKRLMPAVEQNIIEIHSLQIGEDARQLIPYKDCAGIHDWNGKLKDFEDTAHVIHQLDLVISVDTAAAHLAGALAVPTWLTLPANADFRWLRDRDDSPWYDMMRLFRQTNPGNWQPVVDSIVDALGEVTGIDLDRIQEVTM